MSRIARLIWKTLPADATSNDRLARSIYGDDFNHEAWAFIHNWYQILTMLDDSKVAALGVAACVPKWKLSAKQRRVWQEHHRQGVKAFERRFLEAQEKHDGSFFRALAWHFDHGGTSLDPWRSFFLLHMVTEKEYGLKIKPQTVTTLHARAEKHLGKIDKDQFRRLLNEIGYPYSKAPTGRPKKLR